MISYRLAVIAEAAAQRVRTGKGVPSPDARRLESVTMVRSDTGCESSIGAALHSAVDGDLAAVVATACSWKTES